MADGKGKGSGQRWAELLPRHLTTSTLMQLWNCHRKWHFYSSSCCHCPFWGGGFSRQAE